VRKADFRTAVGFYKIIFGERMVGVGGKSSFQTTLLVFRRNMLIHRVRRFISEVTAGGHQNLKKTQKISFYLSH
jgi:hypothetical protein